MSCAFYLKSPADLQQYGRSLTVSPLDAMRMSPNTGSMPMLRTQKDADITAQLYRDHPILVNRSDGIVSVWPVRYQQGTHNMSSDSTDFVRLDLDNKNEWLCDEQGIWRS